MISESWTIEMSWLCIVYDIALCLTYKDCIYKIINGMTESSSSSIYDYNTEWLERCR